MACGLEIFRDLVPTDLEQPLSVSRGMLRPIAWRGRPDGGNAHDLHLARTQDRQDCAVPPTAYPSPVSPPAEVKSSAMEIE